MSGNTLTIVLVVVLVVVGGWFVWRAIGGTSGTGGSDDTPPGIMPDEDLQGAYIATGSEIADDPMVDGDDMEGDDREAPA